MDIRKLLVRIYMISQTRLQQWNVNNVNQASAMICKSLFPGSRVTIISISRWWCLFKVITELKKKVHLYHLPGQGIYTWFTTNPSIIAIPGCLCPVRINFPFLCFGNLLKKNPSFEEKESEPCKQDSSEICNVFHVLNAGDGFYNLLKPCVYIIDIKCI